MQDGDPLRPLAVVGANAWRGRQLERDSAVRAEEVRIDNGGLDRAGIIDVDLFGSQHQPAATFAWPGGRHRQHPQRAVRGGSGDPAVQDYRVAEEPRGLEVSGLGVDVGRSADLGQATGPHHRDLVGEGESLALVVCDQDRRDPGLRQNRPDRAACRHAETGVQGGERLVEQHQSRPPGKGSGQGHPLLLPAGDLVRPAAGQ